MSGTITGSPTSAFVTVAYTNNGIQEVTTPSLIGEVASSYVTLRPAFMLQEGVYRDTITVTACRDVGCASQFVGSPQTVNVTYRVGIAANPTAISALTIEGLPTAAQNVDLSFYAGSAPWTMATTYSSGTGWLVVQPGSSPSLPASSSLSFNPMPPGDYSATLDVTVTAPSVSVATRRLPVTYTVLSLLNAPAPAPFSVTSQTPAAGQTRSIAITTRDSSRQTAWTAALQEPTPWLNLTAISGNTNNGGGIQMALVPAEVEKLRNGTFTAHVVVTPALSGASPVVVPVQIQLDRIHVSTVAPYIMGSHRSASVIIRGDQLNSANITGVTFGSTPATSWYQDSDVRVTATFPPLPAGRYPVTLTTSTGAIGTSAELLVQDSLDYANATGSVRGPAALDMAPVFDAERGSCYFVSTDTLTAVRRTPSGWVSQVVPLPPPLAPAYGGTPFSGATLSTDGRDLLLFSTYSNSVVHLDPVTLQETSRFPAGPPATQVWIGHLQALDDNTVVFQNNDADLNAAYKRYDPARRTITLLPPLGTRIESPPWPSRAGNKFVYSTTLSGTTPTTLNIVDSTTGASEALFTGSVRKAVSDGLGNRWAIIGTPVVFTDGQGTEIGRVAIDLIEDAVMSHDGKKFVYFSRRFSQSDRRLGVIDLTNLTPGVTPPEVATIPLPGAEDISALHLTPDEREVVFCGQELVRGVALP